MTERHIHEAVAAKATWLIILAVGLASAFDAFGEHAKNFAAGKDAVRHGMNAPGTTEELEGAGGF